MNVLEVDSSLYAGSFGRVSESGRRKAEGRGWEVELCHLWHSSCARVAHELAARTHARHPHTTRLCLPKLVSSRQSWAPTRVIIIIIIIPWHFSPHGTHVLRLIVWTWRLLARCALDSQDVSFSSVRKIWPSLVPAILTTDRTIIYIATTTVDHPDP
jgi:hypothetical protein